MSEGFRDRLARKWKSGLNVGWRQESARHSLSAKGVRTGHVGRVMHRTKDWTANVLYKELTAGGTQEYAGMEQKLRGLLGEQMVDDVKTQIQKIEASIPTTKNHYGNYMSALNRFKGENRVGMAQMFIILGANRQGVVDALKVLGGSSLAAKGKSYKPFSGMSPSKFFRRSKKSQHEVDELIRKKAGERDNEIRDR